MSPTPAERGWLEARGVPDHVLAGGLAGLVGAWEDVAARLERGYALSPEDWLNDLDGRELIFELAQAVPEAVSEALDARLAAADARVRAATEASERCVWGDAAAAESGWAPEVEWWYWLAPAARAGG